MITTGKGKAAEPRTSREARTVVCVDDEPLTREALHRLLRREPYDLYMAETPERALSYVQEHDVNLLVADQRMPGMSGVELLEEVRKVSPSTRGLILTAYPESVLVEESPGSPPPPLIAKPWDDDTLRKTIQDLVREPASGAGVFFAAPKVKLFTVLAPLDGSPEAETALTAILPFERFGPMRVEILRVLPRMRLYRDVSAYLEKWGRRFADRGIEAGHDVRWGDPADQILRHARHIDADLIALSARARSGFGRFFKGGVPEQVLRGADVPLLVSRPAMPARPWKRILVPLDGSTGSEAALPEAVRLAKAAGASIDLVRAATHPYVAGGFGYVPPPEDPAPYLQAVSKHLELEEVPAAFAVLDGSPAREIARHAARTHADLICMTSRGRRGLARWILGSVAEEVFRIGPCPVLVRRVRSLGRRPVPAEEPWIQGLVF